jgi:hypothetical protein
VVTCLSFIYYMFNRDETNLGTTSFENGMNHFCLVFHVIFLTNCSHLVLNEEVEYVDDLKDLETKEVYSDEDLIQEYEKGEDDDVVHNGQLKLLVAHMAFLYEVKQRKVSFDNVYLVGCGTGHTNYVIMRYLGKKYKYFLYDPVANYKMFESMVEEGYIIDVSTNKVSQEMDFLPRSIMISDIRSELDDESILRDNFYQWSWARRVEAISMKFKIPRRADYLNKDYMIPTGKQFIQPFRSRYSRETRIFHFDKGAVYRISIKEHYRRYRYMNTKYRWSGYSCYDCQFAANLFKKVELPIQAATIVPKVLNDEVFDEGGYERLVPSNKAKDVIRDCIEFRDRFKIDEIIVDKLSLNNVLHRS